MDYWSCALEDTGSMLSDVLDFPVDAYSRNRIPLAGWEPQSGDHTGVIVDSGTNFEACARVVRSSSLMESMSSHSSSVVESNSRNAPSSDLKLGRFADSADGRNDKLSGGRLVFSASPTPHAKKARILNTRSQTPLCQVYGCNKDLSSSKDYQKRHRVCDVHSKTPRVIVNGMEQRFCQQCSRFHLLVEFDEVKRSCRRRLAGHNERRRKPHYITVAGETHRLLQSYRERYEQVNWPTRIKLEEESTTIPIASSSILPTEEFTSSSAASATNDSNRVVQSSCALSLLSADSQYFGHLDRYTTVRSLNSHPSFNYRGSNKLSAKHTSAEECVPSGSSCSKPNSNQLLHRTPLMVSSADRPEKADGPFDESNIFNTMSSHSPEEGSTVDLLQLSSHLQRVEQQRTFVQVKNEHDDFFGFRNLH